MKTKTFITLLEMALERVTGEKHEVREVPYDPKVGDPSVPVINCLGFVLQEHIHMAEVAAQAMYIIWEDPNGELTEDDDKDEALGDFVVLIGTMRVLPYMQWHCAFFPHLTADQMAGERNETETIGG